MADFEPAADYGDDMVLMHHQNIPTRAHRRHQYVHPETDNHHRVNGYHPSNERPVGLRRWDDGDDWVARSGLPNQPHLQSPQHDWAFDNQAFDGHVTDGVQSYQQKQPIDYGQHPSHRPNELDYAQHQVSEVPPLGRHYKKHNVHDYNNVQRGIHSFNQSQLPLRHQESAFENEAFEGDMSERPARVMRVLDDGHSVEDYLPSYMERRKSRQRRKSVKAEEPEMELIRHLSAHQQAELYRSNLMKAQVTGGGDELDALKYKSTKAYRNLKVKTNEFLSHLEIWGGSFKEIEGHFGTGVLQFFRFVKIIFHINIWVSLITFLCICIPQLVLPPWTFADSTKNISTNSAASSYATTVAPLNSTANHSSAQAQTKSLADYVTQAEECTVKYIDKVEIDINKTAYSINVLVDFLQGTGWMERTILFYGFYFNKTYYSEVEQGETVFNMPLAFLLCTGAYFFVSLVIMLNSMAKGLTESITSTSDRSVNFCNKVFCGWDYALSDLAMAKLKRKNLRIELESDLAEEKRKEERKNRTASTKAQLYAIRIAINLLVMAVLGGSFYLIVFVTQQQSVLLKDVSDEFLTLLVQFLPSLTITVLYFILPLGFEFLIQYEQYSPEFEIEISLFRIVFVRLASLAVLIITAYVEIGGEKCGDAQEQKTCGNCPSVNTGCWETYIGQQIYKLVILDFLVHVGVTIVELIRKLVVHRWNHVKLFNWIGFAEFLLPVNVLDIVYTQTLCWVGAFYSPLIPVITLLKVFLIFYLKKWSLLINQKPSKRPYRASSSYLFFTVILILAFAGSALPVGWAVGRIKPSQSCGPFRIYSEDNFFMFLTLTNTVLSWPDVPQAIFTTIGSAAVYIPLTVILLLLIFYYSAVASGHKKMIKLLESQLGLEGKDKQFLLSRVNHALKKKGRV